MGYEDELLKYLTTVISEADKRIVRGNQRLVMANTEHVIPPTPEQLETDIKIENIKKEISNLVAEAEALGNEGKVEEAQLKTEKCDQLRIERLKLQEMREKMLRPFEEVYKRRPMEVCEICGAMLFIDDAPQRLEDHIQGKQHVGYARIREYMASRQKKRDEMENKNENGGKDAEKSTNAAADGSGENKSDATDVNSMSSHPVTNDTERNDTSLRRDGRSADRKREDHESRRDDDRKSRNTTSSERRRSERDREHKRDSERSRDDDSRRCERDPRDNRRRGDDSRERQRSRDRDKDHDKERNRNRQRHDDHRDRRHDHSKNSDSASKRSERSRSRSRRDSKSRSSRNESSSGRHRSRDRSHGCSQSQRDRSRSRH